MRQGYQRDKGRKRDMVGEKDKKRDRSGRESEDAGMGERLRKQVWERERSRGVKIKNIKKQNHLYGCFRNNPQDK